MEGKKLTQLFFLTLYCVFNCKIERLSLHQLYQKKSLDTFLHMNKGFIFQKKREQYSGLAVDDKRDLMF